MKDETAISFRLLVVFVKLKRYLKLMKNEQKNITMII